MVQFMLLSTRMHTLRMSHNNLRGQATESVEKVLQTL